MSLLEVVDLVAGYGRLTVVHEATLRVGSGEIVAVLGANGAGKSTLLKTIAGHLPVTGGRILLEGEDVTDLDAYGRTRAGVGYVPQGGNVFGPLSVRDNLAAASLFRPELAPLVGPITARFPRLAERSSQLASTLSGGERQMLAVGSAMAGDPRLLLLDEPTAGLAPMFVHEIVDWMKEVANEGRGVVWVVEQNPETVLQAAQRAYFMAGGQVRDEQPAEELAGDPERLRRILFEG